MSRAGAAPGQVEDDPPPLVVEPVPRPVVESEGEPAPEHPAFLYPARPPGRDLLLFPVTPVVSAAEP